MTTHTTTEHDKRNERTALMTMVIIHAVILHAAYFVLAAVFDFPEILRRPPAEMLKAYMAHKPLIQSAYYLFTLSGLSLVALAVLFDASVARLGTLGRMGLIFGVLAGILTSFGFVRWVFLVPQFAQSMTSGADQAELLRVMGAFHAYAGVALGENLAFVCHGLWMIMLSLALGRAAGLQRSLVVSGVTIGVGIAVYSLEQFGGPLAALGPINIPLQLAWLVWMVMVAVAMRRSQPTQKTVAAFGRRGLAMGVVAFALLLLATM